LSRIPVIDKELAAAGSHERLVDNCLVDSDQHVIHVVDDTGGVCVVISNERELVDLRSRLTGGIGLPAHISDRGFEAVLADGQIIDARVDVIRSIDDIPDKCADGEQLLRHAVRDRREVTVGSLEPECDSIFPNAEPLRSGQSDVQFFARIRCHHREVQIQLPL